MRKWGLRLLRLLYVGLIASLPVAAVANYTATQGAGTNFGSVVIGGVHFFSNLVCDFTTANQCAAVKAASTPAALTDPALVVQNAQEHIDLTAPTPSGTNMIGYVGLQANTTGGGTSVAPIFATTTNNATPWKAAAGTIYDLQISNSSATALGNVRLYDTATAPAAGAPCNSATGLIWAFTQQNNTVSPGATFNFGTFGKAFSLGLVICITGAVGNNDNTNFAGAANTFLVDADIK